MTIHKWLEGLSNIKYFVDYETNPCRFFWHTSKGFIHILLRLPNEDSFTLYYKNYNTGLINTIEGPIDSMRTYNLNKTLKQLFISLEDA